MEYKSIIAQLFRSTLHILTHRAILICLMSLLCQQSSYAEMLNRQYITTSHVIGSVLSENRIKYGTQLIRHFGFDGQLTDSKSNWQFLGKGYRAYNPLLHRFMSRDSMSPFDKGGLNGYVFADNNPVMRFDPTGHIVALQQIISGVITGALFAMVARQGAMIINVGSLA